MNAAEQLALEKGLRRTQRRRRLLAFAFVAPLLAFILIVFVLPLADMLRRSVWNAELTSALPGFSTSLQEWKRVGGKGVPDDEIFDTLATELKGIAGTPASASAARRLNYDLDQGRALIQRSASMLADTEAPAESWKNTLIAFDPRWGEPATWAALDRATTSLTDFFLLSAIDLQRDVDGNITARPQRQAIYVDVLMRTGVISFTVTVACLLLGFPVAYLLARQPPSRVNLLLIFVLVPFWTPLLVRTASWVVVLQETGLVNQMLITLGIVEAPVRLLYNRAGVVIAMTHILLPFMILPLYSVMRGIPRNYVRAAASLGAGPLTVFFRVYLPLVMPGVAAGALLVFVLAIGYYVTPALVGGPGDQMISYFVAFNTNQTVNWSLAASLGTVLLIATVVLFFISTRLSGRRQIGVFG